jgi:hypothetical protein
MMKIFVTTLRGTTLLAACVLCMCLASRPAAAGQGTDPVRETIDVSALGPQVGEQVPAFNLADQAGRMRDLASIMGPRGAMVVFVRSADW